MRSVCRGLLGAIALLLAAPAGAVVHFPAPTPTAQVMDLIGALTINGIPAQPGDEVAVFDPQGVLCGRVVVTTAGRFGILHIYGDDPTTPQDEGALPGDPLVFRVWDASAGVEYTAAQIRFAPGAPTGAFVPSPIPPVWQPQRSFSLDLQVQAFHFASPTPTPFVHDFAGALTIGSTPARPGDEVAVFDPQGVLCGRVVVTTAGQYGILHVYGDDPATPQDEGASPGDRLTFVVWDAYAGVERPVETVILLSGTASGGFVPAPIPPLWQNGASHALDITLQTLDIDGDGQTLANTDGQLVLRYLFGLRGADLIAGNVIGAGAQRNTAPQIEAYLARMLPLLDVDANGVADGLSDGVLILRYLQGGYLGAQLTNGALAVDATRTQPTAIQTYLSRIR